MTIDAAGCQSRVRRYRSQAALTTAVLLALCVVAACGSRRSRSDLLAAAGTNGGASTGVGLPSASPGPTNGGAGVIAAAPVSGGSTAIGAPGASAGTTGGPVSGASSSAVAGTSGAPTTTKSAVTIAALGAFSGVAGQSQGPYLVGLRAWIRMINDQGGLNGHPVNPLIVADDGGDSARNRQLAQQLIEQNHVLALVFDTALDGSGTVGYVTQSDVPFIGSAGVGQYFYQSPVYFPQMPVGFAFDEVQLGEFAEMQSEGKTKLATIVCVESPTVCNAAASVAKRGAPRYGAQVVYATTASIAAPDYSAECLNARNAGAQVILVGMDAASAIRIQQSCARQGYHPIYAVQTVAVNADMAADDGFEGAIIAGPTMPLGGNLPALGEFRAAMARYAAGVALLDGQVETWTIGKILQLGAAHLPDGDINAMRKALLGGLDAIPHGYDLGITAPLEYNPGKPATPVLCWFNETLHSHQFVPVNGGRRTCAPYDPGLVS
jgi:branched-chain amino acid transport system substrate-binding protein